MWFSNILLGVDILLSLADGDGGAGVSSSESESTSVTSDWSSCKASGGRTFADASTSDALARFPFMSPSKCVFDWLNQSHAVQSKCHMVTRGLRMIVEAIRRRCLLLELDGALCTRKLGPGDEGALLEPRFFLRSRPGDRSRVIVGKEDLLILEGSVVGKNTTSSTLR